jgi:hypothetical protein
MLPGLAPGLALPPRTDAAAPGGLLEAAVAVTACDAGE